MTKFEKFFFMAIGPFIIMLGMSCLVHSIVDKQKFYISLQNKAKYLLSLNCKLKKCVTEGQIIYTYSEYSTNNNSKSLRAPIYHYRYYFEVNGKTYINDNLRVFSEGYALTRGRMRYIPSSEWDSNQYSTEKIIYDPYNPNINLPLEYAKVLPDIPNPYVIYEDLLCILLGIYFTVICYKDIGILKR